MIQVPSTQRCFHSIYVSTSVLPTLCWLNSSQNYFLMKGVSEQNLGTSRQPVIYFGFEDFLQWALKQGALCKVKSNFGISASHWNPAHTCPRQWQGHPAANCWTTNLPQRTSRENHLHWRPIQPCPDCEAAGGFCGLLTLLFYLVMSSIRQNACLCCRGLW